MAEMAPEMTAGELRLRRLRIRSWRRGMKEMDLILGPFADGPLAGLDEVRMADYEAMMDENDQDLYRWITARLDGRPDGRAEGPAALSPLLDVIAQHAATRLSG